MICTFGIVGAQIFRYIRPLGASLGEIRTLLALPGHEDAVLSHWLQLAAGRRFGATMYEIIARREHLQALSTTKHDLQLLREREIPIYVIEPGPSWDAYRASRKRNIKESLRHCYNSLARQGWQAELHVVTEPSEVITNLPQFYALHSARANASMNVFHPDYFLASENRDFLEDFIRSFPGKTTQTYLFSLHIEGKPVAMRLGFMMGQELYLYCSGFDLSYARHSVMTTLLAEVIKWAIAQAIPRINLSTGQDVSKTRWGPSEKIYTEGDFVRNGIIERRYAEFMIALNGLISRKWFSRIR
jgi:CelD/BcsL family acetyltransferase involved in cellulose biosynthesis